MEAPARRCSGQCCERFMLPIPPGQIEFWKKLKAKGRVHFPFDKEPASDYYRSQPKPSRLGEYGIDQLEQVLDMVVFLGTHEIDPCFVKGEGKKTMRTFTNNVGGRFYHYTCKNYDREAKSCMIYETRPDMCRSHGSYGHCRYKGCTLNAPADEVEAQLKSLPEPSDKMECAQL